MKEAGRHHVHTNGGTSHITPYSTRYASKQEISKFKMPRDGAPADAVHQMLKDELDLGTCLPPFVPPSVPTPQLPTLNTQHPEDQSKS